MTEDFEKMAGSSDTPIFLPLGRKKAYEEVSDEIRKLIHSRRLQPSHRLPTERDLAEQFGVSRMVVREAIRTLERSGLLAVKKGPRGGIFVTQQYDRPITDSIANLLAGGGADLANLFEMRLLIEPFAASRAADLASGEELDQLAALLHDAEGVSANLPDLRSHNIEFHRTILRISRNPVMGMIGDAVLTILSNRIREVLSPDTSHQALGMHRKILEALRKHQSGKAKALMEEDIQATGRRLAELGPETLRQLAADPTS